MTKRRDIFIRNARINKGKENRGYYENFSEEIDNQREMMEKERESVLEEFEQREAEEGIWRDSEINEETILESSENWESFWREEGQENYSSNECEEESYENEISSSDYSNSTDDDIFINDIIKRKIEKLDKNQRKYLILKLVNNNQTIFVFPSNIKRKFWDQLAEGEEYNFVTEQGENNRLILKDFEIQEQQSQFQEILPKNCVIL